jgi:hypothetical protein
MYEGCMAAWRAVDAEFGIAAWVCALSTSNRTGAAGRLAHHASQGHQMAREAQGSIVPPQQTVLEGRRHSATATSPRMWHRSILHRPFNGTAGHHPTTPNDSGANTTYPCRHHTVNQTMPPFPRLACTAGPYSLVFNTLTETPRGEDRKQMATKLKSLAWLLCRAKLAPRCRQHVRRLVRDPADGKRFNPCVCPSTCEIGPSKGLTQTCQCAREK